MDPISVLVVDEEPGIALLCKRMLTRAGYDVTASADGAQALDRFREELHDVVVSDVRLPGLDGLELLARVRAISPDTPVVVITAQGTRSTMTIDVTYENVNTTDCGSTTCAWTLSYILDDLDPGTWSVNADGQSTDVVVD